MTAKHLAMVGLGAAVLILALPARAGPKTAQRHETGTVQEVDPAGKQVTLMDSTVPLTVTEGTEIRKDGRQATLADIQEGDQVRASYSGAGAEARVTKIEASTVPEDYSFFNRAHQGGAP